MKTKTSLLLLCSVAFAMWSGARQGSLAAQVQGPERWEPAPVEDSISIRDGNTGERRSWPEMVAELAKADVVFLGETHDDHTTHRVELAIYDALLQARDNRVVLAMEMFERDVQQHLDRYVAGEIDESTFLANARPWGNYREAYRPLVERARADQLPVVASNFPRPFRMKMMQEGPDALKNHDGPAGLVPAELLPNSDLYWKRTDNAIRGHAAMMGGEQGDRLTSTQSLWDNSMGEACVLALERHPGHSVVHVNGGFHTQYHDGTVAQVRQRKPDAKLCTVSIQPSRNPATARLSGAPVADFVVFADNIAKNLYDGDWSVVSSRANNFRIHVPEGAPSTDAWPLLIWLGDDGLTAEENLLRWKTVCGNDAVIVTVELPFRQQERDLSRGGRWFWPDSFSEDIPAAVDIVEEIWRYVLYHYPIDRERVCVAGEGTGATVAVSVAMMTSLMDVRAVGVEPRGFAKLRDFPLPLLEDWGTDTPPRRTIEVIVSESDQPWWEDELKQYRTTGIETQLVEASTDPWLRDRKPVELIAQAMGADFSPPQGQARKSFIRVDSGSSRALFWGRLAASKLGGPGVQCAVLTRTQEAPPDAEEIELTVSPNDVAQAAAPLCPGPFGGTTVLVVPAESEEPLSNWLELEKNDPLTARSRFHRLRIATTTAGDHALDKVLQRLTEQNRNNVLIVPAVFYAGESIMRTLEQSAAPFTSHMTISWQPGLGDRLPVVHNE